MSKAKTVVHRVNYLHVSARTNGGAPRMFQAKIGETAKRYVCECPRGGQGCSHVAALYTFLYEEAAQQAAGQPAHVGA